LKHYIGFETIAIPELKNTKNISETEQKEKEADLILKALEITDEVMLLDENGKQFSSVGFRSFYREKCLRRISAWFLLLEDRTVSPKGSTTGQTD